LHNDERHMRVAVTKHLNEGLQIFVLGTFVKHAAAEQLSKLNQIEPATLLLFSLVAVAGEFASDEIYDQKLKSNRLVARWLLMGS
jgi:hypothetical protein